MNKVQYTCPEIIENKSVGYILIFNDLDCIKEIFTEFDLVTDGHTWENIIKFYCEENSKRS